ncbi:MAG: hypothetical protein P4M08_08195 [Oligoflexia bacterium]|nr:hypothetical protein [Oligoflexia bacterium]
MVTGILKEERGGISPLCAGLLLILSFAGFGTWGLLRAWRFQVETQFRLDHRVAREALSLQRGLRTAEASNQRMTAIRAAAAASSVLAPQVLAAIRAELEVEYVLQEGLRIKWEAEQARWMLDFGSRMALAEWERLPEDEIGPQPYTWKTSEFVVETRSGSRSAAAKISNEGAGGEGDEFNAQTESSDWHAEWTNFH